jgi:hypothetical protein
MLESFAMHFRLPRAALQSLSAMRLLRRLLIAVSFWIIGDAVFNANAFSALEVIYINGGVAPLAAILSSASSPSLHTIQLRVYDIRTHEMATDVSLCDIYTAKYSELVTLAAKFPLLESISISQSPAATWKQAIHAKSLRALRGCPNIKRLEIHSVNYLADSDIEDMRNYWPQLSIVGIADRGERPGRSTHHETRPAACWSWLVSMG